MRFFKQTNLEPPRFLDSVGVEAEVKRLTAEAKWSLMTFADRLVQRFQLRAEGADLYQEAMTRILGGRRRVPIDKPFPMFLGDLMLDVARQERKKLSHVSVDLESELGESDDANTVVESHPDTNLSQQDLVLVAEVKERLEEAFADWPLGLRLFELKLEGRTEDEIIFQLKLSPIAYDSSRKKMERRIAGIRRKIG